MRALWTAAEVVVTVLEEWEVLPLGQADLEEMQEQAKAMIKDLKALPQAVRKAFSLSFLSFFL